MVCNILYLLFTRRKTYKITIKKIEIRSVWNIYHHSPIKITSLFKINKINQTVKKLLIIMSDYFHECRGRALHQAGFRMDGGYHGGLAFGGFPIGIGGNPIRVIPIGGMVHLTNIERENERLHQENQRLENERLRQENERLRNNSGNGGNSNRLQPGRFGNGDNSNRSQPGRFGNGGNNNRSPHCSSKGSHSNDYCRDCCAYAMDNFWEQSFCNTCGKDIKLLIAKMRTP